MWTPAAGSRHFDPAITLQVTSDDPDATILANGSVVAVPLDPTAPRTFDLVLEPGANTIELRASDRVCNESVVLHEVFYHGGLNPDINRDGEVDIQDISRVSSCVDQNLAEICACRIADTDSDGLVDLEDVGFVQTHFGESGYPIEARDYTAPTITVGTPAPGTTVQTDTVLVSGSLDDRDATLTINGVAADVIAGSPAQFSATVPIGFGEVSLEVLAVDAACNQSITTRVVTREVRLDYIVLRPASLHLIEELETQVLEVIAHLNNGSSQTIPSDQIEFDVDNQFVAGIAPDGTVTALANGSALITASYAGQEASTAIIVEFGGAQWSELSVELETPVLRGLGAVVQLSVVGIVSGEPPRDLTQARSGTVYGSSDEAVVRISPDGLATAIGPGTAEISASNTGQSSSVTIEVLVSSGSGLLIGQAFDDGRGIPLPQAEAWLLSDGRGNLDETISTMGDSLGRFSLAAMEGSALVRITAEGYTPVERVGSVAAGLASELLDARLTLRDAAATPVAPALGGRVEDSSMSLVLEIEAGALAQSTPFQLTPISGQGLQGRLPMGWSPLATCQ